MDRALSSDASPCSTAPPGGRMGVHVIAVAWKQRHLLSTRQHADLPTQFSAGTLNLLA